MAAGPVGGKKKITQILSKVIGVNEASLKIPQAETSLSWLLELQTKREREIKYWESSERELQKAGNAALNQTLEHIEKEQKGGGEKLQIRIV